MLTIPPVHLVGPTGALVSEGTSISPKARYTLEIWTWYVARRVGRIRSSEQWSGRACLHSHQAGCTARAHSPTGVQRAPLTGPSYALLYQRHYSSGARAMRTRTLAASGAALGLSSIRSTAATSAQVGCTADGGQCRLPMVPAPTGVQTKAIMAGPPFPARPSGRGRPHSALAQQLLRAQGTLWCW